MKKLVSTLALVAFAGCAFAQPPAPAMKPAPAAPAAKAPAQAPAPAMTSDAKDIVDTLVGTGMNNTLVAAVKAAGLADALKGKGPFTVFAPTDDAFKKLPAGTLDSLMKPENKTKLANILKFHVIQGAAVMAADVVKMKDSAKTLQGSTFAINVKDGKVSIGNKLAMANVTKTDITASNGVIHEIDTVLMPEEGKHADAKKDVKQDAPKTK